MGVTFMPNPDNANWAGTLLGIHALTALHPGSGTALGTVDLPVLRERHTHWPTIAGSALKGILRDACRNHIAQRADLDSLPRHDDEGDRRGRREGGDRKKADATLELNVLFGPPTEGADKFGGALSVTDARLLAFPVRSLRGVFAWVSCPHALDRLKRDAELAGLPVEWKIPQPESEKAAVNALGCPCLIGDDRLLLEEFEFVRDKNLTTGPLAEWISRHLLSPGDAFADTRARFEKQFVVLHDDDFTHFARHATEVMARVGLNYDTKTVKQGALFYQEFLPPETLMYSMVLASPSRAKQQADSAQTLLASLERLLKGRDILQIGGDETTGKGLCAVRLFRKEAQR
jgi:CRISPR-associated protein Cmr4